MAWAGADPIETRPGAVVLEISPKKILLSKILTVATAFLIFSSSETKGERRAT